MRWHDAGPLVAMLLVPLALLWSRRGFLAVLLLLGAGPAAAAGEGDMAPFWRLWLTSDQRGRILLERGEAARAAALFTDPIWAVSPFTAPATMRARPPPSARATRPRPPMTAAMR